MLGQRYLLMILGVHQGEAILVLVTPARNDIFPTLSFDKSDNFRTNADRTLRLRLIEIRVGRADDNAKARFKGKGSFLPFASDPTRKTALREEDHPADVTHGRQQDFIHS